MAIRDRIARLRVSGTRPRTSSPWWVNTTTSAGRPTVLAAALIMSAPAEYHLARAAGFGDPYAYGMPLVLSSYAGIAAVVAATRPKGARGRWSAIIGAGLALVLAMAAQIIGHMLTTGHMTADSWKLVAVVSAVPPLVVGHLLHLAATHGEDAPQDAPDVAAEAETPSAKAAPAPVRPAVVPASASLLPTVAPCGIRPAEQDAEDGWQDARDAWRDTPDAAGERRLISAAEVAAIVNVDPSTVRGWVARGLLSVAHKDNRGRNWFDPASIPSHG